MIQPKRITFTKPKKWYDTNGWSADGKQITFVRGQIIRHIVLIENFK